LQNNTAELKSKNEIVCASVSSHKNAKENGNGNGTADDSDIDADAMVRLVRLFIRFNSMGGILFVIDWYV